jgi:hypothetical protein
MNAGFTPGMWVCNPIHPEWGIGQIQSAVGPRVTVNFEHAGKITMNLTFATLEPTDGPTPPCAGGR